MTLVWNSHTDRSHFQRSGKIPVCSSKGYDRHEEIEQMCEVSDFESGTMSGWIGVAMGLVSPNLTCISIRYKNYLYFLPKHLIFVIFRGFAWFPRYRDQILGGASTPKPIARNTPLTTRDGLHVAVLDRGPGRCLTTHEVRSPWGNPPDMLNQYLFLGFVGFPI